MTGSASSRPRPAYTLGRRLSSDGPRPRSQEELIAVHVDAQAFFRRAVEGSWVPAYLQQRRLECALEETWGAGFAPGGWTTLTDYLRGRGWSDQVLLDAGLSRLARTGNLIDHLRDRLVLPIQTPDEIIGFVGRCAPQASQSTPKYLNSPRTPLYDKSSVLFGAEKLVESHPRRVPILVEGPLDAIAVTAHDPGFVGAATCGTALTPEHVRHLGAVYRFHEGHIAVGFDSDPAGEAAAVRAWNLLAGRGAHLTRLVMPPGQDPAGILAKAGPEVLESTLSHDRENLLSAVVKTRTATLGDQLQWVEGRVRAARLVAPLLLPLTGADREAAVLYVAAHFDLLPDTVRDAVTTATHEQRHRAGAPGTAERAATQTGLASNARGTPLERPRSR